MSEITGGQAVHNALVRLGVTTVFGIPSIHNIPIFDAILQGGKIEPIITRHEQAAVHAADGYSRASGRLGVAIASTGPGTTNCVTGLYEAGFASSRVMLITGQVETWDYGKNRAVNHQADNQLPMLRTVARWVESPRFTDDLAAAVFRCAADILSGRPQPGAIEIPIDLQYATTQVPVGEPLEVRPLEADSDPVAQAAELIASNDKRVILAGGGVVGGDAAEELQELAAALNAPVFVTVNGKGAISDDHELAMGTFISRPDRAPALKDAGLIIAIGTRFRGGSKAWDHLPGKLIHLDIDPDVHDLVLKSDVSIIADAKSGIRSLLKATNAPPGDADFLQAMVEAKQDFKKVTRKRMGPDMEVIMDHMRSLMPDDAVFARDMTVASYTWGNDLFPVRRPRTSMNPNSGAIGPGLPLAIGSAAATGKKTVAMHGDGGVMLHIGELATAAQYQLPIVLCIFNDGGYGVLRGIQALRFDGRQVGVDLATPDFTALAGSMGIAGERIKGTDEFKAAFTRAMEAPGPYVLDIDLPSLTPMRPFGDHITFERRE